MMKYQLTRQKKRKITSICIALFVGAFVVAILLNLLERRRVEELRQQEMATRPEQTLLYGYVTKRPIYWQRRYSAKVEPQHWVAVSSEISGRVSEVAADIGDHVHKGQLLVSLDKTEAILKVDEAQARLNGAFADEGELKRKIQSRKSLAEEGVIDEDGFQSLVSQHKKAQSQVELFKATLGQIQHYLSRHEVLAPVGGDISERFVQLGETIQPMTPVMRIVSDRPYYLRFGISDTDLGYIQIGDEVEVQTKILKDVVRAHVTRVSGGSEKNSGLFQVEVRLPDDVEQLKPGIVCQALLERSLREGLIIPTDFILPRAERFYVYRVKGSKESKEGEWIEIKIFSIDNEEAEVEEGLSEGDKLLFPQNAPIPPADL